MQRAQTSQYKSALVNRRLLHSIRQPIVPTSLTAVPQRIPFQRKPVRLLRVIKTDLQQTPQIQYRVPVVGNSTSGGGSGALYEAHEEAARRIALRLHDESAQMLATVYLQLAIIARDCPDSTVLKINQVIEQLDGVREQLRGLSHELSPPILDQLGLMPALHFLAKGVRGRSDLKIVVCGNIIDLPRAVGAVLYRVVQEALSNVVRHAHASEAQVRLSVENNKVFCLVSDDGIGLKPPGVPGLGLTGIHERVSALKGRCEIASGPKGGMQLQVEIPL